jgi:hypothetical protein
MLDPLFSVEAIDAAVDYNERHSQFQHDSDVEYYLHELDKAHKKIDQLFHFIEMTEALTYDQATAKRIRSFLQEEGIWPASQQKS